MKYLIIITVFLISLTAINAKAADNVFERRLSDITYSESEIYQVTLVRGYVTHLELQKGEFIQKHFAGDPDMIAIGSVGHLIALKPKTLNDVTNITFITNKDRVYTFEVHTVDEADTHWGIRFKYDDDEKKTSADEDTKELVKRKLAAGLDPYLQLHRNSAYVGAGDHEVEPINVFDNGDRTWFEFKDHKKLPLVYMGIKGEEEIVQRTVDGNFIIIPHVSRNWTIRQGKKVICVRGVMPAPTRSKLTPKTNTSSGSVIRIEREIINVK